ncbi:MAG: FMN-binding protein [Lachnospiraceae bacterium]|nr:FMN-binding protein [Lachnospiraceae bacterium]MDY4971726.1 FMN-binding protein [Lachnospiraceae bacterium]
MKYKNFLIRLLSFLLVVGALGGYNSIARERQQTVQENENKIAEAEAYNESITALENTKTDSEQEADVSGGYADGIWEGTGIGFGGEIRVAVTVENGKITGVEILSADSEDQAYFNMAKVLPDRIVEAQSAQIDTVSGATFSSTGILEAAQDALNQAENAGE